MPVKVKVRKALRKAAAPKKTISKARANKTASKALKKAGKKKSVGPFIARRASAKKAASPRKRAKKAAARRFLADTPPAFPSASTVRETRSRRRPQTKIREGRSIRPAAVPWPRQSETRDQRAALPVRSGTWQQLTQLRDRFRQLRNQAESAVSDTLFVRADESASADSSEVQTLAAVRQNDLGQLALGANPSDAPPVTELVRSFERGVAITANASALSLLRRASPGLKVSAVAYAYPQWVHSLGSDLLAGGRLIAPTPSDTRFTVKVVDAQQQPLPGVDVSVLLSFAGDYQTTTTDANGNATLGIPASFDRAELVVVETKHTYWSMYGGGFARAAIPQSMSFAMTPLGPDPFQLMSKYAPYDANAGAGVTVAVIDSGVGPHADVPVAGGQCTVTGDSPADYTDNGLGHGTHVAGIIAATRNATTGSYGLAPRCRLRAYRVFPRQGNTARSEAPDIAAAIDQAVADGCDIINLSLGSLNAMPELPPSLDKARNAGVAVFAATGNDGTGSLRYPARYSHTIAVCALGRDACCPQNGVDVLNDGIPKAGNEFVAKFSNFGTPTAFIGPGVSVISTYPNNFYAAMSGTSMATPFAAGMAARLLSQTAAVLTMARTAQRADAIFRLVTDPGRIRQPGWSADYGSYGVMM